MTVRYVSLFSGIESASEEPPCVNGEESLLYKDEYQATPKPFRSRRSKVRTAHGGQRGLHSIRRTCAVDVQMRMREHTGRVVKLPEGRRDKILRVSSQKSRRVAHQAGWCMERWEKLCHRQRDAMLQNPARMGKCSPAPLWVEVHEMRMAGRKVRCPSQDPKGEGGPAHNIERHSFVSELPPSGA